MYYSNTLISLVGSKSLLFSSASSKLLFLLTPNLITFRLRLCFKHFKTSSVNRHLQHKHTFN